MNKGYVYALVNDAMPGIVKIGRTERDVYKRAHELYQTGVPLPFKVLHSVYVPDCVRAEMDLHYAFDDSRVNAGREFFMVDSEDVASMMDEIKEAQIRDLVYEFEPEMSVIWTDHLAELIQMAKAERMRRKSLEVSLEEEIGGTVQ